MNVPGPGSNVNYESDPHIRLQKWGANYHTNTVNLESDLMGLTRNLNRDNVELNNYSEEKVHSKEISYPNARPFVEESRASHPAWMYRDLEHPVWETPFINPQANVEKPFHDNIQTRILEKDNYKPKLTTDDFSRK